MLTHATLQTLRTLNLLGMAAALEQQLAQPELQALTFEERLGLLIDQEVTSRENRRLTRLLQQAKLKVPACIEDIDYLSGLTTSLTVLSRKSLTTSLT